MRRLKPDMKGPILCFVGPPGVGKTSSRAFDREGAWIASFRAFRWAVCMTRRRFADIRRTYIGALPGQIIQHLNAVEVKDPGVHAG